MTRSVKQCRSVLGITVVIAAIMGFLSTITYTQSMAYIYMPEFHQSGVRMPSTDDLSDIGDSQIISRLRQWNYTELVKPDLTTMSGPFCELLKKKPPVFLPGLKNPCWYDDDDNRRPRWRERICKEHDTERLCKLYSGRKRPEHTSILRCLPYFMLIGQPKSGSTDLFQRITQHPDVKQAISKEPHWWTRWRHCYLKAPQTTTEYSDNFNSSAEKIHDAEKMGNVTGTFKKTLCKIKSPQTFTEYLDYFNNAAKIIHDANDAEKMRIITGDGSQSTLWDHNWWWNQPNHEHDKEPAMLNAHFIRHIIPDVKLLVILRNPVDRLFSAYLYFSRNKKKSVDKFHSMVIDAVNRFNTCLTKNSLRHCVYRDAQSLSVGVYVVYLKDWMEVFRRQQFLVLSLDDYSTNSSMVTSRIYKFLGLRTINNVRNRDTHYNAKNKSARRVGQMLNETRLVLEQFYKPFNQALSMLMNDESFLWGNT